MSFAVLMSAISSRLLQCCPVAAFAATFKVGAQQCQTCGILEASEQLKGVPYPIEWFNFPVAQALGEGAQREHFPMTSARLTKEPTWLT